MKKLAKFASLFVMLFSLTSCSVSLPSSTIEGLPAEIYSSILVCIIGCILFLIIGIKAKKADPLAKPKGILLLAEMAVEKVDSMVEDNMGKRFSGFGGYVLVVFFYVYACFLIGITGLQSPMAYYIVPFSIAFVTFMMIHITSMHYKKWKYFLRYGDPFPKFPIFLPVNLLSMWAPLLSMSFRLFGNAIAGYVLMSLIYSVLEKLSLAIFNWGYVLGPIVAPIFHAYFDIFSGAIQTLVFVMLTMLLVAQEGPDDDEVLEQEAKLQ